MTRLRTFVCGISSCNIRSLSTLCLAIWIVVWYIPCRMPNEASRIRTFANILSVEGICAHGCVWVKQSSGGKLLLPLVVISALRNQTIVLGVIHQIFRCNVAIIRSCLKGVNHGCMHESSLAPEQNRGAPKILNKNSRLVLLPPKLQILRTKATLRPSCRRLSFRPALHDLLVLVLVSAVGEQTSRETIKIIAICGASSRSNE